MKRALLLLSILLAACTGAGSKIDSGFLSTFFSLSLPFTAGTDSQYELSSTSIELVGGVARLKASLLADDEGTAAEFGAATHASTQWDGVNNYVRLNASTNTSELDASWAPQWASLYGYWKLNGAGNVATNDPIAATVGASGTASNSNGAGFSYVTGQLSQGLQFDGANDYVNVTGTAAFPTENTTFSVSLWFNSTDGGATRTLVAKGCAGSGTSGFGIFLHNGRIRAFTKDNAGLGGLPADRSSGTASLNDGRWHHALVVFTTNTAASAGNAITIYVDGRLDQGTQTGGGNPYGTTGADNISFGARAVPSSVGTYYPGGLDEVAVWSGGLTAADALTIYNRQSAKYAGTLTSRVLDAFAAQTWPSLSAVTTLPFLKELGGTGESTTNYASTSGTLGNNLLGAWDLNESAATAGAANDFADLKGTSPGEAVGAVGFADQGILGNGVTFAGTTAANFGNVAVGGLQNVTVSYWVKPLNIATTFLSMASKYISAASRFEITHGGAPYGTSSSVLAIFGNTIAAYTPTGTLKLGAWHHILLVYDGTGVANADRVKIYINGTPATVSFNGTVPATFPNNAANLYLGGRSNDTNYFTGVIDEFAIWSRSLTAPEALEVYRRGGNRLKYQLRNCTAADCSDQEALSAKGWKGPDNTNQTYFSELYNSTNNVLNGVISAGSPTMTFANFASLALGTNRYLQYRAIFESDDESNLCNYGSGAATCSPELKSVSLGTSFYDSSTPTITSKAAIGLPYSSLEANGFTENGASCASGLRYSLSGNGSDFYYWDGSAWSLSTNYATASNAAAVSANLSSLPAKTGVGTIRVRTYMPSTGASTCQLDELVIRGKR